MLPNFSAMVIDRAPPKVHQAHRAKSPARGPHRDLANTGEESPRTPGPHARLTGTTDHRASLSGQIPRSGALRRRPNLLQVHVGMLAARWVGSIIAGSSCCIRARSACATFVATRRVVRFVRRWRLRRLVGRRALLGCRDVRWWLWRRHRWPVWRRWGAATLLRRRRPTVGAARRQRCHNRPRHQRRRARSRSLMNVFAGRVLHASRRRMARRCVLRTAAPGPTKTLCSCKAVRPSMCSAEVAIRMGWAMALPVGRGVAEGW